MRAAPLFLLASLAVAGCDSAPKQAAGNSAANAPLRPDAAKIITERWKSLFGNPAAVVAAANEFGYKSGPLARSATAGEFRAEGTEQVLPEGKSAVRIATRFSATSGAADRVDTITFTFDIGQTGELATKNDRDALRIPGRIVLGFLSRFEVYPDEEIRNAIRDRTSATKTQYIANLAVVSKKMPGSDTHDLVNVTIKNAGAPAPA